MTIKDIIEAFKSDVEEKTGMQVLIMPQTAKTGTGHLELYFSGIEAAGESSISIDVNATECLRFSVIYRTGGTHLKWIDRIMSESRKLENLTVKGSLSFIITLSPQEEAEESRNVTLCSRWNRRERGQFEYPDAESSAMSVSYTEAWAVSINYPAHMIAQETEE